MALLRYVSHPDVDQDPTVPVPRWSLSDRGRARAQTMLRQPWLTEVGRVVSSEETKALETARIVADHLDLAVEVRSTTGEVDRSSTGFIVASRHEELADRLFGEPTRSADGWERAIDAQARVAEALADLLAPTATPADPDVLVVGHGGVGTLLYCQVAGLTIDRRHDQPGQGHYWSYDRESAIALHPWCPIDDL